MDTGKANIKFQKFIVIVAVVLLVIKMLAYFLTNSVSVLTDALESIVNVVAGVIGLYSLIVAARPRDDNHPYGHGKAEFLSAAVEGTMIVIAGLIILYESVMGFLHPRQLLKLDYGIILIIISGAINYLVGYYAIKQGEKNRSLALIASGKHLQSDTYSTIGIVIGLTLIYITKQPIIDSIVAFIFGGIIIYTGYKILRTSIAGIMDEADKELLSSLVNVLNAHRQANWIDLHNLRVIKYGRVLHIDCHLTVPWYLNVRESHMEIDALIQLVKDNFGKSVEFFVHTDACLDFSCNICYKDDCSVRQHPFQQKITWTLENISSNRRHKLPQ